MQLALFSSLFLMGFLGSWHCGVMCGPLSCNFKAPQDFFSYHLGRLISYLLLGIILYYGTHYFLNSKSRPVKIISTLFFAALFILFGLAQLNILKNKHYTFKYYKFQFKLFEKSKSVAQKFPLIIGLLTGLLLCGWLYSFLLLSTQMKTLQISMLLIFIFWFTALPAFVVFTGFMKYLIKNSPVNYQTISGIVLILAGLFSLLGHWAEFII